MLVEQQELLEVCTTNPSEKGPVLDCTESILYPDRQVRLYPSLFLALCFPVRSEFCVAMLRSRGTFMAYGRCSSFSDFQIYR